MAVALFAAAVTHVKALFFVSLVNVAVFVAAAILFRDRRYVVGSLLALVLATGSAIPCLNRMDVIDVDVRYSLTALAALAVAMTATGFVDRVLNRIPLADRCSTATPGERVAHHAGDHRETSADIDKVEAQRSPGLAVKHDGTDRNLCQIAGWILTALLSVGWTGAALFHFGQPLQPFAVTQFGFLLAAFAMFTVRNPHYVSGSTFWLFLSLAAVSWFAGSGVGAVPLIAGASIVAAIASFCSYGWLKLSGVLADSCSLHALRVALGVPPSTTRVADDAQTTRREPSPVVRENRGGRERQVQAFVVPMCDLSLFILSLLAVAFHLPNLVTANLAMSGVVTPVATAVSVLWLFAAGWCFRSRTAAAAGTILLPLWVTAALPVLLPVEIAHTWYPVLWAVTAAVTRGFTAKVPTVNATLVGRIAEAWLMVVVGLSCLAFSWPARLAAAISLGVLFLADRRRRTAGIAVANSMGVMQRNPLQSGSADAGSISHVADAASVRADHLSTTSRQEDRSRSTRTWLAIAANIQLLLLVAAVGGLSGFVPIALLSESAVVVIPLAFLAAAVSVLAFDCSQQRLDMTAAAAWTAILRAGMVVLVARSLVADGYTAIQFVLMSTGFAIMAVSEFLQAIRRQQQAGVWLSFAVTTAAVGWLFVHGVIEFGVGVSQFVLLGTSVVALAAAKLSRDSSRFNIARKPFVAVGQILPAIVAVMGFGRELFGRPSPWLGWNSLAMFGAAGIYFHMALVTRKKRYGLLTGMILNAALILLWRTLNFTDPQWYLVPVGLSVLGFVELMKKELPPASHDPLRYLGALTILVSPTFNLLGSSWMPHLSLMVFSVAVILAAIGLRLRALAYTGSAFLLADLVAMVVRSTIDNPGLLWIYGVAFGATVIALAAICENHREKLLARIRMLSAELATWK
ncbi:MAG: hypothetical protein R3C19_06870 [Planctomycetaceae bacterium]